MTALLRFFSPLGEVAGMIWLLCLLAAVVLLRRHKWSGAFVLILLALLQSFVGNTYVAKQLIATLEAPYARIQLSQLPAADAVVVLGGGYWPSEHDIFQTGFSEASERIITGLELMRQNKGRALVLGGGSYPVGDKKVNLLELMRGWLNAWKITDAPLFCLDHALNTHAEALATQALAEKNGWKNIILVTSAAHMRRAEAAFKNTGLSVSCAPCDFLGIGVPDGMTRWTPVPGRQNYSIVDSFLREEVGWWVYGWNGWLKDHSPKANPPAKPGQAFWQPRTARRAVMG
jgi:uncharacterized SAM-binding protein YcdF (DUF218 family)